MSYESENILETKLIQELKDLGYNYVKINNEADLLSNLRHELGWLNETVFSQSEFDKILNHLNRGNVFERATTLRERMHLVRDDNSDFYVKFLEQDRWCQNHYQVTNQVTMEGTYQNRYDVTILINGLPLIQIELKRRGIELKEAFNQINRYQRYTFGSSAGLYNFVQIFVISNGVNTKYYANNKNQSFKQTFFWTNKENKILSQLELFTRDFLEPCHISKMIVKYVVLNQTQKILMVLRPYQFYAIEAILHRVEETDKNGYIWHTTGSGKTLTSFKAAQVLMRLKKVQKVIFVVDRKDLDYQTSREFNSFSAGCVDATNNTTSLVRQLSDTNTKLIVTTIQKLNNAIFKSHFQKEINFLRDQKIVFIFDECHRSQFGETHNRIRNFFKNAQLFGFTGTPIFVDNAVQNELGKRTTKELFDECLHKYLITDAIRDENVLRFSVEYIGKYKEKEGKNFVDIEVEGIDTKELFESPERTRKITDYIIANHDRKTHSREFTAILCCSSIQTLIKYYEFFRTRKEEGAHNLKIATIFSYAANEDDPDADGQQVFDETLPNGNSGWVNPLSRDKLEEFIGDYNSMFNTKFSTKESQSFYNYYNDISKKVRNKEIDILLVVNMFLTGFDSVNLNTLYVDKNLKHHGLIQAYSRTNRILNERKSQGNIVCFRNLKEATDFALALFSYKDAKETIFIEPYDVYVKKFNDAYAELLIIAPTIDTVNEYQTRDEDVAFVFAFRKILRIMNVLKSFVDFSWYHLDMKEQDYEDYKSKYLDIYHKLKEDTEKVSILNDVDFELELLHRDDVNVAYILKLLAHYINGLESEKKRIEESIEDLLGGTPEMRSKKEMIMKFIRENLPSIVDEEAIEEEFRKYWEIEREKALQAICTEENISRENLQIVISQYIFSEKLPLTGDIIKILEETPSVLLRRKVAERVIMKIVDFVETYVSE